MSTSDGMLRDEPNGVDRLDVSLDQTFDLDSLVALRSAVAAHADRFGLPERRVQELVLVAHELASNAIRHGGGHGRVRLWRADGAVTCEISDTGPEWPSPSSDRFGRPPVDALGGRGLWLAYHLCDRFEVRSGSTGTVALATMLVEKG
jgi:anti-sigma regulatory factor (Ser/Thr protein kinase)